MNILSATYSLSSGQQIEIALGDLTEEKVDAIVNAANSSLKHGGGIAQTILKKGGAEIQRESDEWVRKFGEVIHSKPAITNSGLLPCKFIIHAVGPIWGSGNEKVKLHDAIYGSLFAAQEMDLDSIAFPAISTGIFNFPIILAANIFTESISKFFLDYPNSTIKLVRIILFDRPGLTIFINGFNSGKNISANRNNE